MSLPGHCEGKHLIKVNCQLTMIHQLCQFGQLLPIGAKVEDVCVNVTGRCHLLKIHNRDKSPPFARDLQTSCGCFSPNAIQDGINAFGMSRVDNVSKVGLRIINEFGGSELLKVQGGSVLKRLGDRCYIHTIDGADHIFTQRAARMRLLQLMSSELPYPKDLVRDHPSIHWD